MQGLAELEQFCKEDWCKNAASRCASLIETNPQELSAVMAAKDASTKYWLEVGE